MRTVSSSAAEMHDELESEAPSHPIAETNLKDPRPIASQHRSSSSNTQTSASVVGSVFSGSGPSVDGTRHTSLSGLDVDLDMTSPNQSGLNTSIASKRRVLSPELELGDDERMDDGLLPTAVKDARAADKTVMAQSLPLLNKTGLSASGSNDARAAARSAFVENFTPPSTPNLNAHRSSTIAGPSRSGSASPQVLDGSPNLKLNTSITATQPTNSSPPISEERSPYVETWDEALGQRVSVIDRRPSTVAEYVQDQPGMVQTWVERIEDVSYYIPAALVASQHSFEPHRAAPVPPTGGERSKNIFKRFIDWIRGFEEQQRTRREVKRATKEQTRQRKLETRERKQENVVRNRNNNLAMKQQVAAHKKTQMDLRAAAKEDDMRHKIDSADRAKNLGQARRMQKQKDKDDARNKKRRIQISPMSRSHFVRGHVKKALGHYGGGCAITPEAEEERKLALSEELDRRIEIAQAKYDREEAGRVRQRAGDMNVGRQEMTCQESQGQAAPPGCAQTLHHSSDDSSDDSESMQSQRNGVIENAVKRVPGGVDAIV